MVAVLLIAGIGLLLAGLLTVGYGILLDLSLGNTLILTGAVVACTGAMMLGLWIVVRELKNIALRLGPDFPPETRFGSKLASTPLGATPGNHAPEDISFPFSRDQPAAEYGDPETGAPPPWREEAASRDRGRNDAPEPVEAEVKPRRNLLFSSSSRKERERAQARAAEPSAADLRPAPPSPGGSDEAPPVTFDDAWPKPERARAADAALARRGGRAPSTFADGASAENRVPPPERNEEPPPVTVLKSGVVDGMAYSLYSDGSIEAQMPEGMMRFGSIDELRLHLDQRP